MSGTHKKGKLVVAFSGIFKRQPGFDQALANSDLTAAMPLGALPTYEIVRRELRDCRGRIKGFPIDTKLVRWTFDFPAVTPQFVFGWLALARGGVANPTGTPADETQTLALGGATGGNFTLTFAFEGLTDSTDPIAYNATNAEIQAALEPLRSIKSGNVAVTGAGASRTITFVGKLAKTNVPLITVTDNTTGGAGVTVQAGTAGAQRVHTATRQTSDSLVLTSLCYGFETDETAPVKLKNLGVDSIDLTIPRRGDVSMRLTLIGSAKKLPQEGFELPACVTPNPLKSEDCRLKVDGNFYNDELREAAYKTLNNILTDEDAFPFDDVHIGNVERQDDSEFIPESLNYNVFGSEGDANYTLGESEEPVSTSLLLGQPGNRVEILSPETFLKLANDPVQFVGAGNKSAIFVEGTPLAADSLNGAYNTVYGYLSQSVSFLQT
ncbi:MAG TPA: hypothetical protein VF556_08580 [Pyrinomonadaceae bacterium]|jgi:hypothetical protein